MGEKMSQVKRYPVNISAPNLLSICVDGLENGEMQGRMYHYYGEEPEYFESVIQLIRKMDQLYDKLVFPQSSAETRSFLGKSPEPSSGREKKEKLISPDGLIAQKGKIGTFVTNVKFRQCTNWQGEFWWKEREEKVFFSSTLELVRLIDRAVENL